jgi:hypothetical protein
VLTSGARRAERAYAIIRYLVTWRGTSTRHALRARPASANRGDRGSLRRVVRGEAAERRLSEGGSLPYLPGLDGMRALAVIAVLLYHSGGAFVPGGFLGVEVFFVISGYLITALILAQWRTSGRVDLKAFWVGRARRLLPALYVVLVVTLTYAVVFLPEEVAGLRADVLAAMGYVTNWYLVWGHESYFEAIGRPSLLKHLWSLAVEEQFYVLWPLVLAFGLSLGAVALQPGGGSFADLLRHRHQGNRAPRGGRSRFRVDSGAGSGAKKGPSRRRATSRYPVLGNSAA